MADNAELAAGKLCIRVHHSLLDSEIQDEINACKADLSRVGVASTVMVSTNSYYMAALRAYLRWQHNFQGKGEDWQKCYEGMLIQMVTSSDYREEDNG